MNNALKTFLDARAFFVVGAAFSLFLAHAKKDLVQLRETVVAVASCTSGETKIEKRSERYGGETRWIQNTTLWRNNIKVKSVHATVNGADVEVLTSSGLWKKFNTNDPSGTKDAYEAELRALGLTQFEWQECLREMSSNARKYINHIRTN